MVKRHAGNFDVAYIYILLHVDSAVLLSLATSPCGQIALVPTRMVGSQRCWLCGTA